MRWRPRLKVELENAVRLCPCGWEAFMHTPEQMKEMQRQQAVHMARLVGGRTPVCS
jgi:hypothetical protein